MFKVDEIVMIKRTHGAWEEGKIVEVFSDGVLVEVDVIDMLRGYEYHGEPQKGYKRISKDRYDSLLQKMKTLA